MAEKNFRDVGGETMLTEKARGKYVIGKGNDYLRREKAGLYVRVRNIANATKFKCIETAEFIAKKEDCEVLDSQGSPRRQYNFAGRKNDL